MKHSESTYGYYPGGDPRNFFPDNESCTSDELEAHRLACRAWDRGEQPDPGGAHIALGLPGEVIGWVTRAYYGVGIYSIEWDCEGASDCAVCSVELAEEL